MRAVLVKISDVLLDPVTAFPIAWAAILVVALLLIFAGCVSVDRPPPFEVKADCTHCWRILRDGRALWVCHDTLRKEGECRCEGQC